MEIEARENAEEEARNSKEKYEDAIYRTECERDELKRERENVAARIEETAAAKVKGKINALKCLDGAVISFLFALPAFMAILTAIKEKVFLQDLWACFKGIWRGIVAVALLIDRAGDAVAVLGDKIQVPWLAVGVHWLLWAIVVIVLAAVVLAAIGAAVWGCRKLNHRYLLANEEMLAVFVVSLTVILWFAIPIKAAISINLVLLFLAVQVVYVLIRCLIAEFF